MKTIINKATKVLIGFSLSLSLCGSQALLAQELSLEERVIRLEDESAIRTLLLSYGRYVDERNWQAFSELFSKDSGTWNGGMGIAEGRNEIIEMMESTIGNGSNANADGSGVSNLHIYSNEFINVDGNTATALSKWVFVMTGEDSGPQIVYIGHYDDELVKEDGQWRFKLRTVYGDITRPMNLPGL